MRIVLDTNVLVSGLLSPGGPPGRIVDLVTALRVLVLHDDRILAEYREVLARPRLGIRTVEAAAVLDLVERDGILVSAPPLAIDLPDPDNLPFLEVAIAGRADALVTGNERHFVLSGREPPIPVTNPASFLTLWLLREHASE
ncbi:putative toxin-antitoxin system toxin component, PIN family [soil metagenome]